MMENPSSARRGTKIVHFETAALKNSTTDICVQDYGLNHRKKEITWRFPRNLCQGKRFGQLERMLAGTESRIVLTKATDM